MTDNYPVFVAAGPQILEAILKLIDGSQRLSLVDTAQTGEECLTKLGESGAKIAIIDFALPQISGVKVIEYLSAQNPDLISVLVSDQANPEFFRSGMLAGAREFIVLPVSPAELEFALERVVQVAGAKKGSSPTRTFAKQYQPDARVIIVGSGKGGVGVSFIAANLSKLLAEEEPAINIALVDFNYQANDLAAIVNVEPRKTLSDLTSVIAELDSTLIKSVAQSLSENLDLFAAPPDAALDELFAADQVRLLIDALRCAYDLVIIDNGAYADRHRSALFEVADLILIILTAEVLAARGGKRFVDCLERLGISKNNMMAVINRWGSFSLPPERISEFIGVAVTERLPESDAVRFLLDEGRLLQAGEKTDIKLAFDQLILGVKQKLSLGEGISVH